MVDLSGWIILGMRGDAWATAVVIIGIVSGLASGRFGPDLVMLSGLAALLLAGVVTVPEAVAGFANPAVLTVGFLYVVAAGLKQTGGMTSLTRLALGRPKSLIGAQARVSGPVALTSAFVNNTPIVALFLPTLATWARQNRISASMLFMPLSYAAIFGGMCSLIGTSTNLVVNELIVELEADIAAGATPVAGVKPFGMFTLAWVGVPVAVVGLAYILIFGRVLLKDRDEQAPDLEDPREYMAAMQVDPGAPIVGQTVEQAGLRQLPGLFLSRIDRNDEQILAVGPDQVIHEDDVLVFVGRLDSVVDLQQMKGLRPMTGAEGRQHARPRHHARLIEAVVSNASPMLSSSIRESGFRSRYDAVVIAVHRNGGRISGKIGDIVLRAGDTLLLEAGPDFADRHRDSRDFYLVSELPGAAAPRHRLAGVAVAILALMVGLITWQPQHAMTFALGAGLLMIATRCCTGPDARASVDWQVLVVIGAAFGLGKAMETSGLAGVLAGGAVGWAGELGPWALLAVLFAVTAVFTSVITNNAAAVLVFPIAVAAAREHEIPLQAAAVVVAVAASAGFASPLGYQTNLMVMGPGGYRPIDFLRFGGPLTILAGVVCIGAAQVVFG